MKDALAEIWKHFKVKSETRLEKTMVSFSVLYIAAKFIGAQTSSLLYKMVQGLVIRIPSIMWVEPMTYVQGSAIMLVVCTTSETSEHP